MKTDPFMLCLLFDFYGEMLTDKQRELFDLYYNEDLSSPKSPSMPKSLVRGCAMPSSAPNIP